MAYAFKIVFHCIYILQDTWSQPNAKDFTVAHAPVFLKNN